MEDADRADAERIRDALVRAALDAWEDAGVQGLCAEGRWEAAVAAMRRAPLPGDAPDAGRTPPRHPNPR
ncbi:MAG TPA: hypothetical protein VFQ45_07700 [Longimicrobium sp.]|nr:hypothetical protein [Longimicrobium sp.]